MNFEFALGILIGGLVEFCIDIILDQFFKKKRSKKAVEDSKKKEEEIIE